MKKERINCEKAKKLDAVLIAKKLGMKQSKRTKKEVWFYYQNEKTASFKIDIKINKWFNHSYGIGGNTLDMVIHILNCSVSKALYFLNQEESNLSFLKPLNNDFTKEKEYQIIEIKKLKNKALLTYLSSRKINIPIAQKYCREIHYEFKSKNFFAISFKNNDDGFEIRNLFFKGCLGKKQITTINNNSNTLSLFESWSDFLSYLTLKKQIPEENFIILNSTSMINKLTGIIEEHSVIKTFLDNDNAGDIATDFIKKLSKNKFTDNRKHYKNHKDLNDYLINRELMKSHISKPEQKIHLT